MKVIIIVAVGERLEIGKDNDLLWHLPADMKFFRETTSGHYILTGRKNYESIPEKYRPLKNRVNIVLTRNKKYAALGSIVVRTLEEALALATLEEVEKLFIIGGGEVYKMVLEKGCVDEMYITHVDGNFEADTYFPSFEQKEWKSREVFSHDRDEKNKFSFSVKHYVKRI